MRCNDFPSTGQRGAAARLIAVGLVGLLAACGGGGGGGGGGSSFTNSNGDNDHPIAVTGGPDPQNPNVNLLLTSVTICTPGTSQCQTIPDILVDTGSFGLRIMASALNNTVGTTIVRNSNNVPLVQCAQFADGFTWGPIERVDIRMSDERAANVPVQIIEDWDSADIPDNCESTGNNNSTVAEFGANGVLGIGVFKEDCGGTCATNVNNGLYYACSGTLCDPSTASLLNQVRNPIGDFAVNNNGVIINLPAVPDQGAQTVTGSMIFGIGTSGNNGLGNARVLNVNPGNGTFPTVVRGQSFPQSFIDTGSNGLFFAYGTAFNATELPTCNTAPASDFFCPAAQVNETATLQAYSNGTNVAAAFSIGNANQLLTANQTFLAFDNIGAPIPPAFSSSFDWGLPFYYGRRVYTALEGKSTPGGTGPYVAF